MFKKYPSIENSYRAEFVAKIREQGYGDEEYIVQEKAHGANFSLWTEDGVHFAACKRTGPILSNENFYNYQSVVDEHLLRLQRLWHYLQGKHAEMRSLSLFGELIGGSYPHADVPSVRGSVRLQKGVYYCPQNSFYGFDIMINAAYYLSVDETVEALRQVGIVYAKPLFRGSLEACLQYPNDKPSCIYQQFDLPAIDDNICEGVVIRPQHSCFLRNGDRVMIKNKNEKWAEKQKVSKRPRQKAELSEEVKALQAELMAYITKNRLDNVISKTGPVQPKDIGKILSMYSHDVEEDFRKDHGKAYDALEKKERKQIMHIVPKEVLKMIKRYLEGGYRQRV